MHSLPIPQIPEDQSKVTYGDLSHGDTNLGEMVADLTRKRSAGKRIESKDRAHLDPDIHHADYPRQEGWRPLFGQSSAAQGHLRNQGVQIDDLFLYFGLFQEVEKISDTDNTDRWRFVKGAPKRHILWGWLQIGEIHKVDELAKDKLPWAGDHPHLHPLRLRDRDKHPSNTLYVASPGLRLGDGSTAQGAGCFLKFDERLVLTDPNESKVTAWRLPRCFSPDNEKSSLTYHKPQCWKRNGQYAYLQSVSQGQEFVLDLEQYPGVMDWLRETIFKPVTRRAA